MEIDIKQLNEKIYKAVKDYEQGVYVEPFGIPNNVKEPVVYMRWVKDGYSGGNCWESTAEYFSNDTPEFKALDVVLKEVCPNISYLKYKEIEAEIQSNEETEWEYYGNSSNYGIKYIPLSIILEIAET